MFHSAVMELMENNYLEEVLVGFEPTGHYWFNLGQFLSGKNIKFVMVNPHHAYKTKELDDNPFKNDCKDPCIIANLVKEGRYFYVYMSTGVYAELWNASNRRFVLVEEHTRARNRLHKWITVYFLEYKGVYTHIDAKGVLMVLKKAATPDDIIKLGVEGIQLIWKDAKLCGNVHNKVMEIVAAAIIGLREGLEKDKMELMALIEDYSFRRDVLKGQRPNQELLLRIKYADKLLKIKGIGITTVSGKHNGRTKISKRGHKRLRYLLV